MEWSPHEFDERVLIVVVPTMDDWLRVRDQHWYRIPLSRAPRQIAAQYLAFYHTKSCGDLRWAVHYYAPVRCYHLTKRREILPLEPDHARADDLYYKVELGPLEALPRPVPARSLRRVTFIMTTLSRLMRAGEIGDLWLRSDRQDKLHRARLLGEALSRRYPTVGRAGHATYSARNAGM